MIQPTGPLEWTAVGVACAAVCAAWSPLISSVKGWRDLGRRYTSTIVGGAASKRVAAAGAHRRRWALVSVTPTGQWRARRIEIPWYASVAVATDGVMLRAGAPWPVRRRLRIPWGAVLQCDRVTGLWGRCASLRMAHGAGVRVYGRAGKLLYMQWELVEPSTASAGR